MFNINVPGIHKYRVIIHKLDKRSTITNVRYLDANDSMSKTLKCPDKQPQ